MAIALEQEHHVVTLASACVAAIRTVQNIAHGVPTRSGMERRIKSCLIDPTKCVGILWVRGHIGIEGRPTGGVRVLPRRNHGHHPDRHRGGSTSPQQRNTEGSHDRRQLSPETHRVELPLTLRLHLDADSKRSPETVAPPHSRNQKPPSVNVVFVRSPS